MATNNTQYELLLLKKIIESKDPELLIRVKKDLFGNTELAKIYNLVGVLFANNGMVPGFDLLSAELENRVTNTDKQKFYTGLIEDIKNKDSAGTTTDNLIESLKVQKQFRTILDGAGKLVDAVSSKDASEAVGTLKSMYESMYQDQGDTLDDGDLVNLAGQSVKYNFRKVGLKDFDVYGFLPEASLNFIGAPSKSGKSIMAMQWLMHLIDNYDGSGYLASYELGQTECRQRMLSSRSGVNIGVITSEMASAAEKLKLRTAEVSMLCDINDNIKDFITSTAKEPDSEFFQLLWNHFKPKENRIYIPKRPGSWDELFLHMQMMVELRNVKTIVIDYLSLVPRGSNDGRSDDWRYLLNRTRELKTFARNNDVRIISPVQLDERDGHKIRWGGGIVTDADTFVDIVQEEGDDEFGEFGLATIKFRAMRNFQTVPGVTPLKPFKLLRQFDVCKFGDFDF